MCSPFWFPEVQTPLGSTGMCRSGVLLCRLGDSHASALLGLHPARWEIVRQRSNLKWADVGSWSPFHCAVCV